MSKDKDLTKELKKTEKSLHRILWITRILISMHPKNFQTPGWVSVVGYCIMITWLCLPFAALIFNMLLLFKIFVGILTLMAIVMVSEKPAKRVMKPATEPPFEMDLSPAIKESVDYQEFINMTWARQKQCWEAGERISLRAAASRIAAENVELYKSATAFLLHQRHGKFPWSKPGPGRKPGKEGPK